ncbi:MAG: hypothetical protein MJZ25_14250 [Fibrobacter sp.]|nr:hypothetical protein [Fibrobacter sp.]
MFFLLILFSFAVAIICLLALKVYSNLRSSIKNSVILSVLTLFFIPFVMIFLTAPEIINSLIGYGEDLKKILGFIAYYVFISILLYQKRGRIRSARKKWNPM